jgi:hypothetical protein
MVTGDKLSFTLFSKIYFSFCSLEDLFSKKSRDTTLKLVYTAQKKAKKLTLSLMYLDDYTLGMGELKYHIEKHFIKSQL